MTYTRASFDIANAYGQQGEVWVSELLGHLRDGAGAVEVKRKSRADDTFFVEVRALRDGSWEPSGLAVSTAMVWAFVIADTNVALFVPRARLMAVIRALHAKGHRPTTSESATVPTKGFLLRFADLLADVVA